MSKKKISETEKKLKNKVRYLKTKNKKVVNLIPLFKEDVYYKVTSQKVTEYFKGYRFKQKDKVKGSTLINILRNKIKDNNNDYNKAFSHLEKKFKKNPKKKRKTKGLTTKGIYLSDYYRAWELKEAIGWIRTKAKENFSEDFVYKIYSIAESMGNYDKFQMEYNKKENEFEIYLIENG